jgi:diguanylate cyclase (GGDEF)-like protein
LTLAYYMLVQPIEQLVRPVERLAQCRQGRSLKALPTQRADELGQLARAVHNLAATGLRDQHEVRRLQRNVSDHIEQATRRQTSHLRKMAWCDELTGLANRRYLDQHLPSQVQHCQGHSITLVCVMMDLDNFKAVNDTQGHAVGDELLQLIGKLINGSIRKSDIGARLGGDEFALIMPGGTSERADQLIGSIRQLLKRHLRTVYPKAPAVDLSAGVVLLTETPLPAEVRGHQEAELANALLAKADRRLYEAKGRGKGLTILPGSDASEPTTAEPHPGQAAAGGNPLKTDAPADKNARPASPAGVDPERDRRSPYPTM